MAATIQQVAGRTYATNYHWVIENIDGPLGALGEDLNLLCTSVSLPTGNLSKIAIEKGPFSIQQAGAMEYNGNITLNFNEVVNGAIANQIELWADACFDRELGVQGDNSEVKGVVRIRRLDRKNGNMPGSVYELVGCFPESWEYPELGSKGSQDTWKPSLTLSYDWYRITN